MSEPNYFKKTPQTILPYTVSWVDWLPADETITAVTWTVPAGITQDDESNTDSAATIILSGGTVETEYRVICHITTTPGGYEDERTIIIWVIDR